MQSVRRSHEGFSIVELVVTITICGIMVPILAAGLTQLTAINNRARDLSLVNMLAQNKAEKLRNIGYNSIPIGVVDFTTDLPKGLAGPNTGSYTVTQLSTGVKQVYIVITYKDLQSPRTVEYKTFISETGVGQ